MDKDFLAIGAPAGNDNGIFSGSAYFFSSRRCLDLRVENLVAGEPAVFTVTGGTPGARVATVVGALWDEEISLGDYVISGGELAAMVIIDGIVRLIPGVLSDLDSALGDSFTCGLLDCAYYTRPETLHGESVPPVLLSGNHEKIRQWRRQDALLRTLKRRPDLLVRSEFDRNDV